MRRPECALCGRSIEEMPAAQQSGKHWFCSPGHFLEWESRPRRRWSPRGLTAGIAAVAIPIALLVGLLALAAHTKAAKPSAQDAAQSISDAFRQIGKAGKHPVAFRVHLTAAAGRVSDAFVQAEYVTHDCKTLSRLMRSLPGLAAFDGSISPADCPIILQVDRENDAHLVRGSRVLKHACNAFGEWAHIPLKATECLQYATIGRHVTNSDGSRAHECDGGLIDVFLEKFGGRWFVVGGSDVSDWGSSCRPGDLASWKRRYPWRSA